MTGACLSKILTTENSFRDSANVSNLRLFNIDQVSGKVLPRPGSVHTFSVVNLDQYLNANSFKTCCTRGLTPMRVPRTYERASEVVPEDAGGSIVNDRTVTSKSGDLFSKIGCQRATREYSNKEKIFSQGDTANAMFYIESGHVKLTVASTRGKRAVLAILSKGDFFGQCCLMKGAKRAMTATAVQLSSITSVKKGALNEVMQREPRFSNFLVLDLLSRMRKIEEDFTDQLLHSSELRLARLLLRLSHFGEPGMADTAVLHISQGTLAEMVGTTRSRISYFMNRFRTLGLIEYNGSLHVHKALRTFLLQG